MTTYEPVKLGGDPRKDASKGQWLKVEPNSYIDATVLVDVDNILSCEQCALWIDDGVSPIWVYTGINDPSHALNIKKTYRAYLPLLVDGEVKIWSMGKQAHVQILDMAEAGGYLKGLMIRIKRTGSGLSTRYTIASKGKKRDIDDIEVPDVIDMLGPLTSEDVTEMLERKFEMTMPEIIAKYAAKSEEKPKRATKFVEVDDDDLFGDKAK